MRPSFSPANPYWQPLFGRDSQRDFLYASAWELSKRSPMWSVDEGGGRMALRIRFHQGAAWKAVWMNQMKHQLGWNRWHLLKESADARKTELPETVALGSRLSAPLETSGGTVQEMQALHS